MKLTATLRTKRNQETKHYRTLSQSRAAAADTPQIVPKKAPAAPKEDEDEEKVPKLSVSVARRLESIKATFTAFVDEFAAFTVSGEEFAPLFMKTFHKWEAETGGSFVAFVRVLIPSLPMDTKGYKAHPAYASADYLRRTAGRLDREGSTPVERAQAIANRPVSPRTALARIMVSIVPLIAPEALETIFAAMRSQLHWTDNQVDGFKTLIDEEQPLVRIRAPRGVHLDQGLKVTDAPAISEDAAQAS